MEASFIEVYNETLRDLLAEGRNPREPGKVLDNNAIKHMADGTLLAVNAVHAASCGACKRHRCLYELSSTCLALSHQLFHLTSTLASIDLSNIIKHNAQAFMQHQSQKPASMLPCFSQTPLHSQTMYLSVYNQCPGPSEDRIYSNSC